MRALIAKGKHIEGDVYFCKREQLQLMPIQKAILTVPVLAIYWDICADCGTLYIFRVDSLDATIQYSKQSFPPANNSLHN
jgi:hypothetical protein